MISRQRGRTATAPPRLACGLRAVQNTAAFRREHDMKLVRFGPAGQEKPGLVDAQGQIRDLSGVVRRRERRHPLPPRPRQASRPQPVEAPRRPGRRAPRPLRRAARQFRRRRPQLRRSRQGDRGADPARADPLQQGALLHRRAERRRDHPPRLAEDRLGGRARHRHRRAGVLCGGKRVAQLRRRLLRLQRRVGARIPDRARRPVDEGQGLPDLRPARALDGDGGRGRRRAEPFHVARRQRQADADRVDEDDDLRLRPARLLHLALS